MDQLTLANPVFAAYAIAAAIMVLKGVAMSWLTVARMISTDSGLLNPEDLRNTPFNRNPSDVQLEPDERVERIRRIQRNDLENLPYFFMAGLLYVTTAPPLWLAQLLFYGFVVTRLAHFVAYFTAQNHEVRAALWTPGSLIILFLGGASLVAAF
ncbi:MAPEG family protein [Sandaracinobacter neustonicus]|uniref:Microsomal glutathione S-transferase 1 n=1 Tax=Sandaracinobacter neustonicus TaxID=1715348 RepID=A0A501XLW5_9SPHN|nr:MAPEG family protein [Sandaracinobacter neustonicus]TPE61580.1 MAPEG family protein [Sandaracinobacter neustonicus]